MTAFKGFTRELTARMGRGTCQFEPGGSYQEERSKTVGSGFHCCENPLECLAYYPLGAGNRYFKVEAAGSIDEDGDERIACTRITLLEELGVKQLAGYGMAYMVRHPMRGRWKQQRRMCTVGPGPVEALEPGAIAISRGGRPMVQGVPGAVLGLIAEPSPGEITAARLFTVAEGQQGRWWTLEGDQIVEVAG